jgi:methyl-accepting chemotaxis protein
MEKETVILERLAIVEEANKHQERRLDKLEESDKALQRLAALTELQKEANEKISTQMVKIGDTLTSVSQNLGEMNSKVTSMESRMETIEDQQSKFSINWVTTIGSTAGKILVAVLIAAVVYFLGFK